MSEKKIFKTFEEWNYSHGEQLEGMELQAWSARQAEINKLKEENKKLRECVAFYADLMSYDHREIKNKTYATSIKTDQETVVDAGWILIVGGKKARECLKEINNELS